MAEWAITPSFSGSCAGREHASRNWLERSRYQQHTALGERVRAIKMQIRRKIFINGATCAIINNNSIPKILEERAQPATHEGVVGTAEEPGANCYDPRRYFAYTQGKLFLKFEPEGMDTNWATVYRDSKKLLSENFLPFYSHVRVWKQTLLTNNLWNFLLQSTALSLLFVWKGSRCDYTPCS
jgi:hypothetical protein